MLTRSNRFLARGANFRKWSARDEVAPFVSLIGLRLFAPFCGERLPFVPVPRSPPRMARRFLKLRSVQRRITVLMVTKGGGDRQTFIRALIQKPMIGRLDNPGPP